MSQKHKQCTHLEALNKFEKYNFIARINQRGAKYTRGLKSLSSELEKLLSKPQQKTYANHWEGMICKEPQRGLHRSCKEQRCRGIDGMSVGQLNLIWIQTGR